MNNAEGLESSYMNDDALGVRKEGEEVARKRSWAGLLTLLKSPVR